MFWPKSGILIPDLYLYGIKIQTNIKQNLVEKKLEKKYNFQNFFWIGSDPAHHFGLGRRCQPIKQWASPLFTCSVNSGEEDAEEEEGGGEGEGRRLTYGGSRCCWQRWRWTDTTAGGSGGAGDDGSHRFFPCFFLFVFLLFFFFFYFFFLSWFSPFYPFSAPLFFLSIPLFFPFLFLFSFSSSSVFSFLSLSQFFCLFFFSSLLSLPCIYRQKTRGERPTTPAQSWRSGRATTMQSPQDCPRGASPLFFIVVQWTIARRKNTKAECNCITEEFLLFSF